ncbi:MAG TPA: indolepyruvate ferredoxin oxidoreductase family protein [Ilumatobacter sp.]|nr:indolepyruvate ferredoxin oxidoreductase family protein [Ilumatobacter sp.]
MTDTARPAATDYEIADRYRREDGTIFVSGVQAIARLPVDQLRIDRRHGLNTAAFISGYQGSPVGMFGEEVDRARRTVPDLPIVNQPGVNEELAATAVMGSQLAVTLDDCKYDGVLGVWYGKGPGIDRASDAIRHAVFASTAPHGGVVAVVGDDPSAKSSTLPSSSDATMVDLHMPILFPGDVQEALDLGRHAVALSRACGLWAGLKLVTPVADGTGTIDVHPERVVPIIPTIEVNGVPFRPQPNGRLITPYTLDMEREFHEVRTDLAREYAALNRLNRVTVHSADDWIGIAACGHTYNETREALQILGFADDDALRSAGIRLFQLLAPISLDKHVVREFADGLTDVLVIEEKNATLELLIRDALYDAAVRPKVWGKRDEHGNVLVPYHGMLDADRLAAPLRYHLSKRLADRLTPERAKMERERIPLSVERSPYFCSGCPHNASTRVEPGTLVGGGIGCHAMVAFMEPERIGDVVGLTCMGNEGAQWIGMAPFVERQHLVQNLGDGTFFHSGSVAIRAAVAAGIDITYKLLHNGTVAMTGGQDAEGAVDVPNIAKMLMATGVKRIIVTSDEPDRFGGVSWPASVEVWDRTRLAEAQSVLAKVRGTTVLIHDQECAAEKRRARSRGLIAKPPFRVVINERICEGCGDCGDVSNCLSVQPIGTPYGRKTTIDQTSCNYDFSCMKGDCPAFATVSVNPDDKAAKRDAPAAPGPDRLPAPSALTNADNFTVRLSGIGGTGVITISQLIGTAAMFDGLHVRGLDQTGLSQKAGPVTSDVRISRDGPTASNHASAAGVDCFLAFDLLAAASDSHREGSSAGRTIVIGSVDVVPTGSLVVHPNQLSYPELTTLRERLDSVSRPDVNRYLDAAAITSGIFGSATSANVLALGVAVQSGALPLSPDSLERAIELNGVAVKQNIAAFRFGRQWAVEPSVVEAVASIQAPRIESLDQMISRFADDLVDYQDSAYAERYRKLVDGVRRAEGTVDQSSTALTDAVARNLYKLMAYKDEYEVARLALLPESQERYRAVGGPKTEVTYHLHPPALRSMGVDSKMKFRKLGAPSFTVLRAMKRVRGTHVDPFGYAKVRRTERAMIPEYERAIAQLLSKLSHDNIAAAATIAALPDQVRGYEHIKMRRAEAYQTELAAQLKAF